MPDGAVQTADDSVLIDVAGGVATVTLNRPARRNAWSDELGVAYYRALAHCDADPAVRAIIVTGAGGAFCIGGDASDLREYAAEGTLHVDTARRTPHWTTTTVRKPVIAAIAGACAGVGLVQAMACDLRVASRTARFTTAFARRGLVSEGGLSALLTASCGVAVALDLLLSGRVFDADEAYRLGVVNRVVNKGDELAAAMEYARMLVTHCSPASMVTIKDQIWGDFRRVVIESAARDEGLAQEAVSAHGDFSEGVASLIERRLPNFAPLPPDSPAGG